MKRRYFFWLEKLKINRNERLAVTTLMVLLLVISAANLLVPQYQPYDEEYYARLDQVFESRSTMLKQKEDAILARYQPKANHELSIVARDTVVQDTVRTNTPDSGQEDKGSKINVNTADAQTLQSLPGIGPTYATRIVEYRQKNGSFTSYEQLLNIKGIGKKRLEKLLPFIQLKESNENQ